MEISPKMRERFGNGRKYYALHGQELKILPSITEEQPAREYLNWPNRQIYLA